jgi:acetylornithine deacetylase/succinyl-diaminopimelate desuccinylase-like protein
MYGRGVAVSKSDFATYGYALLALKSLGAPLAGTVELHLTYDDEAGGAIGPKWLLDQGLTEPDYAISAGFSYAIVTAHSGCLHLEVRITGKSAHAARPETGHDALEAAARVLHALSAHRKELERMYSAVPGIASPTLVVGLIGGGINTNVVPDALALRLDRRIIPEEDGAEVERRLALLIRESIAGQAGVDCAVRRIMLAEPLRPAPGLERLVQPLQRNAEAGVQRADPDLRRAALHRCPSLCGRRHSDRAVRRRTAHAHRGERPCGGRTPAARGPAQGDRGGGAHAARFAGRMIGARRSASLTGSPEPSTGCGAPGPVNARVIGFF